MGRGTHLGGEDVEGKIYVLTPTLLPYDTVSLKMKYHSGQSHHF